MFIQFRHTGGCPLPCEDVSPALRQEEIQPNDVNGFSCVFDLFHLSAQPEKTKILQRARLSRRQKMVPSKITNSPSLALVGVDLFKYHLVQQLTH